MFLQRYFQGVLFKWALFVFLSQNEDTKEKKKTPSGKVHEVTEKTSQTKGPVISRSDDASAVRDSCKDKKQQGNQKPVDKIKGR